MNSLGYSVEILHKDIPKLERKQRFGMFNNPNKAQAEIFVTTDVVLKLLEPVTECKLVLHYQLPEVLKTYVYRLDKIENSTSLPKPKSFQFYDESQLIRLNYLSSEYTADFRASNLPTPQELHQARINRYIKVRVLFIFTKHSHQILIFPKKIQSTPYPEPHFLEEAKKLINHYGNAQDPLLAALDLLSESQPSRNFSAIPKSVVVRVDKKEKWQQKIEEASKKKSHTKKLVRIKKQIET